MKKLLTIHNTKESDIMTVDEVSKFLRVGRSTVQYFRKIGKLQSHKTIGLGNRGLNTYLKKEVATFAGVGIDDTLLRPKEVKEYLSIGLSTVWLYSKTNILSPIKISDRVTVFSKNEIDSMINNKFNSDSDEDYIRKQIHSIESKIAPKQKELIELKKKIEEIKKQKKKSTEKSIEISRIMGREGYERLEKKLFLIINAIYQEDNTVQFSISSKPKYTFIDKGFFMDKSITPILIQALGSNIINRVFKSTGENNRHNANTMLNFYQKFHKPNIVKMIKEWHG